MKHVMYLFFFAVLFGCKSTKLPVEDNPKTSFLFDYKLSPNAQYKTSIQNTVNNRTHTEGDFPQEAQLPGMDMAGLLNSSNQMVSGEQRTIITGDNNEGTLSLVIHTDSIISTINNPHLNKLLDQANFDQDAVNNAMLKAILYGKSLDGKKILIDSVSGPKTSVTGNNMGNMFGGGISTSHFSKIAGANAWNWQVNYPRGRMSVGDTFIYEKPPYKYKEKKERPFDEKRMKSKSPEKLKRKKEIEKMRDMLKKARSEKKTYYILERVENNIAYFKITSSGFEKMDSLVNSTSSGFGEAEYDLNQHYYRKLKIEESSESVTHLGENAKSISVGTTLKEVSITKLP